jgi:hypothetical protein
MTNFKVKFDKNKKIHNPTKNTYLNQADKTSYKNEKIIK